VNVFIGGFLTLSETPQATPARLDEVHSLNLYFEDNVDLLSIVRSGERPVTLVLWVLDVLAVDQPMLGSQCTLKATDKHTPFIFSSHQKLIVHL
jgi:hypothetical protein